MMGGRFERKNGKAVSDSLELNCEYKKNEQFHGRVEFQPLTTSFKACAVVGVNNTCRMGGHLAGKGIDFKSLKYSFGASYTKPEKDSSWLLSIKTAPHDSAALGRIVANIHGRSMSNSLSQSSARLPSELATEIQH